MLDSLLTRYPNPSVDVPFISHIKKQQTNRNVADMAGTLVQLNTVVSEAVK